MSSEVAVRAEQPVVAVKPHRTRAEIIAKIGLVGLVDDPSKSLAKVIKDKLRADGLSARDANTEYMRLLKEDLEAIIDARIREAEKAGWTKEYRAGKVNAKTGEEGRFSVGFIPPKAPKQLTLTEQQKFIEMLGGKDSAKAKELMQYLADNNRLVKVKAREVEATVTPVNPETPAEPTK